MTGNDVRRRTWEGWAAAVLIVLLGLLAWLRPTQHPRIPPRIPASQAEPWMADCLPGVGAKTRDQMAAAIRAGGIDHLPRRAREEARLLFDWER